MLMDELIAANWYAPVCSCAGGNYGVLNTFITEKIEHGNSANCYCELIHMNCESPFILICV